MNIGIDNIILDKLIREEIKKYEYVYCLGGKLNKQYVYIKEDVEEFCSYVRESNTDFYIDRPNKYKEVYTYKRTHKKYWFHPVFELLKLEYDQYL